MDNIQQRSQKICSCRASIMTFIVHWRCRSAKSMAWKQRENWQQKNKKDKQRSEKFENICK